MSSVVAKSQTRRINNLRSKLSALEKDLAEALKENEVYESFRSKNVTKRESKGRPKVAKKADESEDLFANLGLNSEFQVDVDDVVQVDHLNSNIVEEVVANLVSEVASKSKSAKPKTPKHVLSDEEKALKKAELDAEKAAKKIELAEAKKLQLAAEKAEKAAMAIADKESKKKELEDAKIAKAEAKKKELEDAKALKKQELEDAKALKKQELDAAKALKKAEEKAKKDALKPVKETKAKAPASKKSKKTDAATPSSATTTTACAAAEEAPVEKVTVSRITINGVKYLKSSTGVLYNQETKEEVGLYDEETGTIKPLPDDEDEEVTEDTYESDSE
jgi:hypothetical protein